MSTMRQLIENDLLRRKRSQALSMSRFFSSVSVGHKYETRVAYVNAAHITRECKGAASFIQKQQFAAATALRVSYPPDAVVY